MTLDGDLGIDSIKRVEIFSVLREKLPDAPEIEAKHLGELETLQHIVDHLMQVSASGRPPKKTSMRSWESGFPAGARKPQKRLPMPHRSLERWFPVKALNPPPP